MQTVIVYVGSFDPFHLGHLEALEMTRELHPGCPTVIVPNNPCHSKSARAGLLYRSHVLSFLFPLYTDLDWLQSTNISVDTRPVATVLQDLKNHHIIGIIGSDILMRYHDKPPKWSPTQWVIFERFEFIPILFTETFHGIPYEYISLAQTQHQHISSTLIRTTRNPEFLPTPLRSEIALHYIFKPSTDTFQTLNRNVSAHRIEDGTFVKTFTTPDFMRIYCENSQLWNLIPNNPFLASRVMKTEGLEMFETLIPAHQTIFQLLQTDQAETVMKRFFIYLNHLHQMMLDRGQFVAHGDLSVTNVLVLENDDLALIDYDKVHLAPMLDEMLREYNQFLGSIKFYSLRHGLPYDLDRWRTLGDTYYRVQYRFSSSTRQHWIDYWNKK